MEPENNGNYWQHEDGVNLEPEKLEELEEREDVSASDEPADIEVDAEEVDAEPVEQPAGEIVNWDAKEHITHEKTGLWFVVLVIVAAGLLALAIFLIKSITFAVLVVVSVVALIIYAVRPPRDIHYSLSNQGLQIAEKLYDFDQFKAFGVLQDGAYFSVVLIPKKHFSPATTVYFPEDQGESIVDLFGAYLPMQEVKLDAIDRLIRRLRI